MCPGGYSDVSSRSLSGPQSPKELSRVGRLMFGPRRNILYFADDSQKGSQDV